MPRASFSYSLARESTGDAGLEGYTVWAAGESVGTVTALLEHGDERYVVAELGTPPARLRMHAIPLADVELDHAALAVRVPYGRDELVARALELDPDRAVRDGGAADASRIGGLPDDLLPPPLPPGRNAGPVDTPRLHVAVAMALFSTFLLLALVALATTTGTGWLLLLAVVPAVLALSAALNAYRAYYRPTLRRAAGHG